VTGSDTLTSLDQVVAAAGNATVDDFLVRIDAELEIDVHVGIEESDSDSGIVIKIAPMYESPGARLLMGMEPREPAWIRTVLVRYPTSLAEIDNILCRLDAEQRREWEGDDDLEDRLGEPCQPGDRPGADSPPVSLSDLDMAIADDALTNATAAALHLIRILGISPGGSPGATHYGATTLLVRHVKILQKTVRFSFTAHHGAKMDLRSDDPLIRQIAQTYTAGKRASERLFDTSPKKLNAYMQRFLSGYTVKDLRTILCTTLAEEEISRIDEQWEYPENPEQLKLYVREVAKFVAAKVGNTWQSHLAANIDPRLFDHWRAAAGVEA
jgi:hypothetical protein